nr:insulin-related peptide 6 [Haliotis discus hannai]
MSLPNVRKVAFGLKSLHSTICVSSITVLALICLTKISPAFGDDDMMVRAFAERFRSLSGEELYDLWHTDCHRRCRAQLIEHINLACSYDPYKIISKRSVNSTVARKHVPDHDGDSEKKAPIFITRHASAAFLATGHKTKTVGHKIVKRGIMEECCYMKACSWEEYGEFCHTHNRQTTDRVTRCNK